MANKYSIRENDLRGKIEVELNSGKPNLEAIMNAVAQYEVANINAIKKMRKTRGNEVTVRKIVGGLKQTINAHGPITEDYIDSASKRIYGALMSESTTKETKPSTGKIKIKPFLIGLAINIVVFLLMLYYFR